MAIHCVFISSRARDGATVDVSLRERFDDVYRVGGDLWLIDTAHAADKVAEALQPLLEGSDKMFVATMTRDVVPVLSPAASEWLTAPHRSWRATPAAAGFGTDAPSPMALAA